MILSILDLDKAIVKNILIALFAILLVITTILTVIKHKKNNQKTSRQVINMVIVAIFSALSICLYYMKFPLPFIFPSFLDIQFSLLPAIVIGLVIGPGEAIMIVLVKALIKLPSTSTMGVGELADLLIGLVTVLTSSLIYTKHKTKRGSIVSLAMGTIAWVATAILINWLIITPAYIQIYFGGNIEAFKGACSIVPLINGDNYMLAYLGFAILPFNFILSLLVNFTSFFVYIPVNMIYNNDIQ